MWRTYNLSFSTPVRREMGYVRVKIYSFVYLWIGRHTSYRETNVMNELLSTNFYFLLLSFIPFRKLCLFKNKLRLKKISCVCVYMCVFVHTHRHINIRSLTFVCFESLEHFGLSWRQTSYFTDETLFRVPLTTKEDFLDSDLREVLVVVPLRMFVHGVW